MKHQYLLALDAGTGSVRAVLFTFDGVQVAYVQHEWQHAEDPLYPGSMDFDWKHNWILASDCVKKVLKQACIDPADIAAVSTTCMREGIVLYDELGQEIWACANVDARSNDEVDQLIGMDPELEQEIYALSGQTYALGALPRLLWVKNKLPQLYERIDKIGMFNDWLVYKLTGILKIEPSNGSTTGMFNLKTRDWDSSILRKAGLKDKILPEVVACGTQVGIVSEQGANDTGLLQGTVVVAGGGDAQLGCIGVGLVKPNQAGVFGGSFWQYEYNTDKATTDSHSRVRVNCHAVDNLWQFEALAFKPGLAMRWYRDAFCQEEIKKAKELGCDPYELMNEEAQKVPAGCYGMMCTFSDVMNFISWRHASPTFTNFDFDPVRYNKYTFYRAIMENTAMVTKGHLELVRESTGKAPEEIVFAGGASKSDLWCQILADVLNLPVKVPVVKEATALGAAILAGYGVGVYEDLESAVNKVVKWDKVFVPNVDNHLIYENMYAPWRLVYAKQLELADEKITRHMWAAPGLSK